MNIKRTHQISEEVRRAIAETIQYKIKDPRIPNLISVSHVEVTNDLSFAKVYISLFEDDEKKIEEALKGINSAKGYIKKELGRMIKLRAMPELIFVNDESIKINMKMEKLIKEVNHES